MISVPVRTPDPGFDPTASGHANDNAAMTSQATAQRRFLKSRPEVKA
jgi:hypothetical protein